MKTVLIDTNIILRYFLADIHRQFKKAKEAIERIENGKSKGELSLLVINELIWILENFYELDRKVYLPQLLKLLALKNLKIIEIKKSLLTATLQKMQKHSLDFTDLYLAEIKKSKDLLTFDKKLKKILTQ